MILIDHMPITLPTGTQVFGPSPILDTVSLIILRLARCTTLTPTFWADPATELDFFLESSSDGGATWLRLCGATAPGGIVIGKNGEATETNVSCAPAPGVNRQVRATVTVTNGPLISLLTLEVR